MRYALAFLIALLPGIAAAQMACGTYDSVVSRLAERYGEARQGRGLSNGFVIELFASEETGTWTVLRTDVRGIACLLGAGDNWESIQPALKEGDNL